MGTNIGQIAANLPAPPPLNTGGNRRGSEDNRPSLVETSREPERSRPGFGSDTLSPSGAALEALDVSLREAQRVVPSPEEARQIAAERRAETEAAREAARAAAAQQQANIEEAARARTERVRPEPAPQARNFETAPAENAAPEAPSPTPPRLDVMA